MSAPAAGERPDPTRSACVLIGTWQYDDKKVADLPTVKKNLTRLRKLLASPKVWGVSPERIFTVVNPGRSIDITYKIKDAAKQASDTLLVYYSGHGFLDVTRTDELFLGLTTSSAGDFESHCSFDAVRNALKGHEVPPRVVVMLDCCYSGKITRTMAPDGIVPVRASVEVSGEGAEGVLVMTSTKDVIKTEADGDGGLTPYTGQVISLLEKGDSRRPDVPYFSLGDVHAYVKKGLRELSTRHPVPNFVDSDGIGALPFFGNLSGPGQQQPSVGGGRTGGARRRTIAVATAAALVIGATGGWFAAGAWGPEQEAPAPKPAAAPKPPEIPGPCGKKSPATLLDVSDALDEDGKNEVQGVKVDGLSALALTTTTEGQVRALAVRDAGEPPHLYDLTLGTAERLTPEVTGVQRLFQTGGEKAPEFDGEGLVLEEGGETVLVSSELGPSISRFRVSDGKQLGEELPQPAAFRPPGEGQASRTRALESLTATQDGRYLFTGMEGPLLGEDDIHGRHQLRIQRYKGEYGGAYALDKQYAYQTEEGLYLSELVALDDHRLLALERGYIRGLGNGIRVYTVDLSDAADISENENLSRDEGALAAKKSLLVDLGACPSRGITSDEKQSNPLLQNVEGMALGEELTGPYAGRRALYLVADNNSRKSQSTRVYALAVDVEADGA
ncbi:esterase-like activity of phytase family protein [Streptomyces sp. NPDC050418]|uniref:caspase, EACC1-associated type n=1 Tax=Streptomyces sp. NPDC050418 TaxID=3365612 RepID=UPI0037A99787